MNPIVGWILALIAVIAGWEGYGWPGLALAVSVIVFWLLMQFNRSLKVMRRAAELPVGHIDSAVMFNAKLKKGMLMMEVVTLTKSLGKRLSEQPEIWAWTDNSGAVVRIVFEKGRCTSWVLERPAEEAAPEA
jgi:hypothetical protein